MAIRSPGDNVHVQKDVTKPAGVQLCKLTAGGRRPRRTHTRLSNGIAAVCHLGAERLQNGLGSWVDRPNLSSRSANTTDPATVLVLYGANGYL